MFKLFVIFCFLFYFAASYDVFMWYWRRTRGTHFVFLLHFYISYFLFCCFSFQRRYKMKSHLWTIACVAVTRLITWTSEGLNPEPSGFELMFSTTIPPCYIWWTIDCRQHDAVDGIEDSFFKSLLFFFFLISQSNLPKMQWKDLFDLIVVDAKKPLFFEEGTYCIVRVSVAF